MSTSKTDSDRRIADRHAIELRVEYRRLNTFFADYTKNISKGGTFIRTDKPLDVGTEFIFALAIPHLSEPLRLRGRVVWTTTPDRANDESPSGMGIRFQYAEDRERTETESIVEGLMRDQLGDHLSAKLLGRKG
ncbi:MAG TPA: TIGR02266 family protein [Polyangiaceae bacterium]|jgi:type IV pilus assembly protein PilZ|nr:TIGR02266 family protein [Polyangiaceae bacterium]